MKVLIFILILFTFIDIIYIPQLIYDGPPYITCITITLSKRGLIIKLEAALRTVVAGVNFLVFLSYLEWRNLAI